MKTLAIIVAAVVVAGAGAVGGYDYATKGNLGILPASWTCCDACSEICPDCCPGCPICEKSTEATSIKLAASPSDEDSCSDCASCCPSSKAKAVKAEAEAPSQPAATEK
jgi:hypothetical protein